MYLYIYIHIYASPGLHNQGVSYHAWHEKTGFGRCPKDSEDVQKIRSVQRDIMRKH